MRRTSRSPGRPPLASGRSAAAALAVVGLLASASCGGEEAPSGEPADTEDPGSEAPDDGSADGPDNQAGLRTGVSDERILFGQSAALTGPAEDLGLNMRLGIEASFHEANQRGGVHGRRLELTTLDDAYEPEAAIANTQSLIESEEVFALIGAVGTPTSRSAVPVAADAGVPYIAPFTGAAFLRDAQTWGNVMNLRASYYQETEEMVARLTEDLGVERIAVMYQDDSFGRAGYQGVRLALDRRGMTLASIGLYTRNTTAVKTALLDLRRGEPEAVIMIGAYQPVATLIAWARHIGMDPIFMTVSFVGSISLAEELGLVGDGVYVSQVVPFPTDYSLPVIEAYSRALSAYNADATPGFVSLEGYLAGRLAVAGLEGCGPDIDRDCFLSALRDADVIDLDGFEIRYGAEDNQGSDDVFLTRIGPDGNYRPVEMVGQDDSDLVDRPCLAPPDSPLTCRTRESS